MATDPLSTIVEEILVHGADDWVHMPEVHAIVREVAPTADAATHRDLAIAAVSHVVTLGLMEVGTVTTTGFVRSAETLASFESRLRGEWSAGSPPFVPGEICWLRLTERGASIAEEALELRGSVRVHRP
jgi:hypothetical protein